MTGLPIYDRVMDEITDLFHPRHYHDPSSPASPEEPVDIATIEQDARQGLQDVISGFEHGAATVKNIIENHLPQLAAEASKVQGSLIVQALEGAFLPPEDEQMIVTLIGKLASYAAHAAEHVAPPAPAEPAPADMAMGQPAGPSVAGVA